MPSILVMPCSAEWREFNSSLYYLSHAPRKKHQDAESYCSTLNASLASIHSMEEHQFLAGKIFRIQH